MKRKNFLQAKFQTFLAWLELLISLNALAPLSSASGSNPADVVLGLSFRTLDEAGGSDSLLAGAAGGGLDGRDCPEGEEEENGENLKGPSA